MEKQVEQILQDKNYHKTFCIDATYQSNIIDCIRKIQNVPLENFSLRKINKESILDIFGTFQNLNLKILFLSDCEIDSNAAACISDLIPNLTKLGLVDGKIRSNEFITIIDAVKNSHSCSKLQLSKIIFDETKTAALIDCIKGSRLVNLVLYDLPTSIALTIIPPAILNSIAHSSLQTLKLQNITFNNETTAAIVFGIKNSSLIKLILEGCTFVDNKMLPIMKAVQQSSIQSLNVGFAFFDDDIEDIMKCVENSNLTKFCFGEEYMRCGDEPLSYDNKQMAIIAASIRNSNLLKVGLICMRIDNEMIDSIKKSSITSLDLYSNYFSHDETIIENEVGAICDLIEQGQLKKLGITFDGIEGAHIRTILSSVKKSEIIKFCVYDTYKLSARIQQEIMETKHAQKLRALPFHKIKSARIHVVN